MEIPSHTWLQVEGDIAAWRDIKTWPNSTNKVCPITGEAAQRQYAPKLEDLLWSANATNVTISGSGTIDGGGWRWWPLRNDTTHGEYWHNCRPSLVSAGRTVGPGGRFCDSGVSDFTLRDVTLLDSPFWVISWAP